MYNTDDTIHAFINQCFRKSVREVAGILLNQTFRKMFNIIFINDIFTLKFQFKARNLLSISK
jgi:hypothetical protein